MLIISCVQAINYLSWAYAHDGAHYLWPMCVNMLMGVSQWRMHAAPTATCRHHVGLWQRT